MFLHQPGPEPKPPVDEILKTVAKPLRFFRAQAQLVQLRGIRDRLAHEAELLQQRAVPGLPPTPEAREIAAAQRRNAEELAAARRDLAEATDSYEEQLI